MNSIIKQYNSMDWDHRVQYFLAVWKIWAVLPFPRRDCQCRNCHWKDIGSQRGIENIGKLEKRKLWLLLLSTSWYSLAELRGTSDSANLPLFWETEQQLDLRYKLLQNVWCSGPSTPERELVKKNKICVFKTPYLHFLPQSSFWKCE